MMLFEAFWLGGCASLYSEIELCRHVTSIMHVFEISCAIFVADLVMMVCIMSFISVKIGDMCYELV